MLPQHATSGFCTDQPPPNRGPRSVWQAVRNSISARSVDVLLSPEHRHLKPRPFPPRATGHASAPSDATPPAPSASPGTDGSSPPAIITNGKVATALIGSATHQTAQNMFGSETQAVCQVECSLALNNCLNQEKKLFGAEIALSFVSVLPDCFGLLYCA